jgi:hypothetical protein
MIFFQVDASLHCGTGDDAVILLFIIIINCTSVSTAVVGGWGLLINRGMW